MHEPFAEFAALLLICALGGALFVRLRQPVLIAYIVVGVLVGPAVFGLVTAHDQIALLAQVGVAVLLFAVGLKLDLHHIRHIGPVALATGLGSLALGYPIDGLRLIRGRIGPRQVASASLLHAFRWILLIGMIAFAERRIRGQQWTGVTRRCRTLFRRRFSRMTGLT